MSSKVTQKTYSPLNKGSYEIKGRKTEKESKAALVMLRLTHFVRTENLVAMEA